MTDIWTDERKRLAVEEAASWLGTKHRNHAMDRRSGIDCVHYALAIFIGARLLEDTDLGHYSVTDGLYAKSDNLKRVIEGCIHCQTFPAKDDEVQFGDVVIFRTCGVSAHCGFCDGTSIYHALAGKCVTRSPWAHWRHRAEWLIRMTAPGWKNDPVAVTNELGGMA